jgi:environmental stress-induced protein Ves
VNILRYRDLPVTRWKNGGGVTREVFSLADPAKAGAFLWRLSIATVNQAGPFSRFEDTDRTIAVLSGGGIVLRGNDLHARLTPDSPPYSFSGDASIDAEVIDGETTDLNAMSRRSQVRHSLTRFTLGTQSTVAGGNGDTFVIFGGKAEVTCAGETYSVETFDVVAGLAQGHRADLRTENPIHCYRVEYIAVTDQPG